MFHKLTADYYGAPTPLQQLASFTAPEPRVIIISPYDQSAMAAIEKAIRDSDLGVNPTDDGKTIRVDAARADRGAPQGLHQDGQGARPRTAGSRSATSVATPSRRSTSSRRTARSARTTSPAPRSGSTAITKKHIDAIDEMLKHKEAELLEV